MAIINISEYLDNQNLSSYLPIDIFFKMTAALLKGETYISIDDNILRDCEIKYQKNKAYERYLNDVCTLNNKGIEYEKKGEIKKAIEKYEKCLEIMYEYNDIRIAWHSPERLRILYKKTNSIKEQEFIENLINYCTANAIDYPEIYTKRLNQLKK